MRSELITRFKEHPWYAGTVLPVALGLALAGCGGKQEEKPATDIYSIATAKAGQPVISTEIPPTAAVIELVPIETPNIESADSQPLCVTQEGDLLRFRTQPDYEKTRSTYIATLGKGDILYPTGERDGVFIQVEVRDIVAKRILDGKVTRFYIEEQIGWVMASDEEGKVLWVDSCTS